MTKTEPGKDTVLDRLARHANVAQFVSFDPNLAMRYAWIQGREPNAPFSAPEDACAALLQSAESHAVNVRAFKPSDSKGHELIFGLTRVDDIAAALRRRAAGGLFTIANELIPIDDGGVSGAALQNVIEFAPCDTPKCVEKPGVASLPRVEGVRLLERVYGFGLGLEFGADTRVEFSLHPIRRGMRREHTIVWELEDSTSPGEPRIGKWPNRFSDFVGDKPYGLLIASLLGFPVPYTTVVGRNVAPFAFGEPTGTGEIWLRTAPRRPVPGKYLTDYGWRDPFEYMAREDSGNDAITSVLAQASVEFIWSGAAETLRGGVRIEGAAGRGDAFMAGQAGVGAVPQEVVRSISETHARLVEALGSVKFEWVWDGDRVWIVQLHRRPKMTSRSTIYPGEAERYVRFHASSGLEALRELTAELRGTNVGVIIAGEIGVTSHVGDILRAARIPSRLESSDGDAPAPLSSASTEEG